MQQDEAQGHFLTWKYCPSGWARVGIAAGVCPGDGCPWVGCDGGGGTSAVARQEG